MTFEFGCRIIAYADDLMMIVPDSCASIATANLLRMLDRLYVDSLLLSVNPAKSVFMIFRKKVHTLKTIWYLLLIVHSSACMLLA